MQLWRMSCPSIRCLQARDLGKPLVPGLKVKQLESHAHSTLGLEDLRTRNIQSRDWSPSSSSQAEEGLILPFSAFLFYPGLWWIECYPSTWRRNVWFTQPTDPNANLFQTHPHRHAQKWLPQLSGYSLAQSSWFPQFTITYSNTYLEILDVNELFYVAAFQTPKNFVTYSNHLGAGEGGWKEQIQLPKTHHFSTIRWQRNPSDPTYMKQSRIGNN